MTRRNYGSHGEIAVRRNGRMMMTVRPEPEVLTPEQCAEIIGYRCLGLDGTDTLLGPSDDGKAFGITRDANIAIAHYEASRGKMTQKKALKLLSDTWFLANQQNYTDMMPDFDEDDYNHRAVLAWVLRIFPKFSRDLTEEEVTTLAQQEESE